MLSLSAECKQTMRHKRGEFYCIVGIDGSGKTSLAHSVIRRMHDEGENCQYVHGLMNPRLSRPFMAIGRWLLARGKSRESHYVEFVKAKRRGLSKHPAFFCLYRGLVFLDYVPQVLWKIAVPLYLGKNIIADRYVYDTLVNLELNVGLNVGEIVQSLHSLFWILPKPDKVFLLDVPEEVALSRKDDVPDIQYLQERRGIYLEMAQVFGMRILDGTAPVEALVEAVLAEILQEEEATL